MFFSFHEGIESFINLYIDIFFQGWTRRKMHRDAGTEPIGKGRWKWRPRIGGSLAMAFVIFCLLTQIFGIDANPEAKRLYDDLLSNYNRLIRPVGNNSDKLTVKMGLKLSQLIDVVSNYYNLFCTFIKKTSIWNILLKYLHHKNLSN